MPWKTQAKNFFWPEPPPAPPPPPPSIPPSTTLLRIGPTAPVATTSKQPSVTDAGQRRRKYDKQRLFLCIGILVILLFSMGLIILGFYASPLSEVGRIQYDRAAIACNARSCSDEAKRILMSGGSVVDAAIAALLCMGVQNPHSMGVGGGFIMLVYINETRKVTVIDAREAAPVDRDSIPMDEVLSAIDARTVAVPGEIRGYWLAYQKFGKKPWPALFKTAIENAEKGIKISRRLANTISNHKGKIKSSLTLRRVFDRKKKNMLKRQNDMLYRPQLAKLLTRIASRDGNRLYDDYNEKNSLTKLFLNDLQQLNVKINREDLQSYEAHELEPIKVPLKDGSTLFTVPFPGSGELLALAMRILDKFDYGRETRDSAEQLELFFHQLLETFKHVYARRCSLGGKYVISSAAEADKIYSMIKDEAHSIMYYVEPMLQEIHGTSHLSIVGPKGDAVSVTSSLSDFFGSGLVTNATGIILNKAGINFDLPGYNTVPGMMMSNKNRPKKGSRPIAPYAPAIVVDKKGQVILAIGGSGGLRIVTAMVQVMVRVLIMKETIQDAVKEPRVHFELTTNMDFDAEFNFQQPIPCFMKALQMDAS